ncbi:MAG: hypothetical protein V4712_15195 [Pseudomonadota bacterium]
MSGNGYGEKHENWRDAMGLFDQCPRALRDVLNYAVGPYHVKDTVSEVVRIKAMHRGCTTTKAIAILARHIEQVHSPKLTLQAYGPTHPEAQV